MGGESRALVEPFTVNVVFPIFSMMTVWVIFFSKVTDIVWSDVILENVYEDYGTF